MARRGMGGGGGRDLLAKTEEQGLEASLELRVKEEFVACNEEGRKL